MKETYFAPAARSPEPLINEEIKIIAESPLIDSLMTTIGGLLAVLDENRQIIALNQALLKTLGLNSIEEVLGCRPGEALNCVHAADPPNGCGTTKSCQTCGAVIAIVSSLESNEPVEKICVAEVKKNGKTSNLYLGVRAAPIFLSGHRFVLLYMQDLSAQQELATLQRVFFHDLNNILTALLGYSEILTINSSGETLKTAAIINKSAQNLYKEVVLQRILAHGELGDFQYSKENIPVSSILAETCDGLRLHPSANNKNLSVIPAGSDETISSDRHIIRKILTNMLINAFEASDEGDEVKIWAESPQQGETIFAVWNKKVIEESLKQRIFQKNFSTKNKKGRGLGTYSMKLFGEEILRGRVYFISQEETGTTFYLKLCRNTQLTEGP